MKKQKFIFKEFFCFCDYRDDINLIKSVELIYILEVNQSEVKIDVENRNLKEKKKTDDHWLGFVCSLDSEGTRLIAR